MGRKKVQQLDKSGDIEKKIDMSDVLKLRLVNKVTLSEIAAKYNVSPQAISQRINKFMEKISDPEMIQAYKDNRADILTATEERILQQMLTPSVLEKATFNNLAYGYQQVFNARRLEENKSTANLQGIYAIVQRLDKAERKEEEVIDV